MHTLIIFGILIVGFVFNRCWSHFMLTDKNVYISYSQTSALFNHEITISFMSYFLVCFAYTDVCTSNFMSWTIKAWLRLCLSVTRDKTTSYKMVFLPSLYEHFFSLSWKTRHDQMNYVLPIFVDELILPIYLRAWPCWTDFTATHLVKVVRFEHNFYSWFY